MLIFKGSKDINSYLKDCKKQNKNIGFVPTMGALHEGHLSLIQKCKEVADVTVCSIFINPTQFNNPDDLKKYPITLEKDIYLLEKNECDVLFLPDVNEMYPDGLNQKAHFNLGYLETLLEGKYRPGHFQGVCQVVKRLLEVVEPDKMMLGQKDYQQCMVLKRLLELMGSTVELIICPTLRDPDGLAMSSRNLRLNPEERKLAVEIYNNLQEIRAGIEKGDPELLKQQAISKLTAKGFKVDYIEITNSKTLKPVSAYNAETPLVALAAAFINDIRLIDNVLLTHN
jgi:pantoate--beta-alanine ligase